MAATLESLKELKTWDDYKGFLKLQLKRINRSGPFYISKEKFDFEINASTDS